MSATLWNDTTGSSLRSYWWLAVLRGVVALLFGIAVFTRPGITVGTYLLLFGAFALASGVLAVISAISLAAHHKQWWAILIEGIAGILIGLTTLYWPIATLLTVLVMVAIWAIFTGIFQIVASFAKFGPAGGRWFLGIGGVLSLILGIALLSAPGIGIMTMILFLGVYLLLFGIDQIVLGLQLRHLDRWVASHIHPVGA